MEIMSMNTETIEFQFEGVPFDEGGPSPLHIECCGWIEDFEEYLESDNCSLCFSSCGEMEEDQKIF
jgi:hypothetical protein